MICVALELAVKVDCFPYVKVQSGLVCVLATGMVTCCLMHAILCVHGTGEAQGNCLSVEYGRVARSMRAISEGRNDRGVAIQEPQDRKILNLFTPVGGVRCGMGGIFHL